MDNTKKNTNTLIQLYSPTTGYYYIKDIATGKVLSRKKRKTTGIAKNKTLSIVLTPNLDKSLYRKAEDAVFKVLSAS